jgi:hypothetical protein
MLLSFNIADRMTVDAELQNYGTMNDEEKEKYRSKVSKLGKRGDH